jgi:hypothetical protein
MVGLFPITGVMEMVQENPINIYIIYILYVCVCRIDVRWIPGTSTTGAFLFDSEHAGGDVVEVGETVLALRSKRTTHDPLDGDHAVHMLEIPQDSCAY